MKQEGKRNKIIRTLLNRRKIPIIIFILTRAFDVYCILVYRCIYIDVRSTISTVKCK